VNDRHDGSSIDLERALVRYMVERHLSRRELLERIAKVGAAAALVPLIAACAGSSTATAAATASPAGPSPAAASGSAAPTESAAASPTAASSPEAELFIYNWTDYLAESVIQSFEAKYGTKVTQSFFSNTDEAYAKLGNDGGGYDLSFPISVDVPSFIAKGAIVKLDKSLVPNIVNLGAEWADPGYDPGNTYTVPYMWWTTGVGYDSARITDTLTSSKALWDPRWAKHISMLDDFQEVFGLTLIQLGYSANTKSTAELDEALALLKQQKPLVRTYSTDTIATMTSGDVWIGQIWGADRFAIQETNENVVYYIPEEGGVKGSDTVAVFSGAPHPIAAQLFINHLLDAHNSADNTNLIYYMGPNAAAKEFIDPAILADPTINPDQKIVDKLEELLNLDAAVRDEYLKRWQELRG
jgi:spermidine/putrescine transport system substrate-binding protein